MIKIRNQARAAELGLLTATVIWGSAFVVVKDTTRAVPPSYLISIRFGIAFLLMCVIFFRRLKKIRLPDLAGGAVIGILGAIGFEFQTYGAKYTTAGKNAFLTSVYCVLVPFVYWAIKRRKPKLQNVAAAFLCIAGVGLLSVGPGFTIGSGDLMSIGCGLFFSFQIVAIDIFTEKRDPILLTILQTAFSMGVTLPIAAVTEPFPGRMETGTVLSLLYLAVFSTTAAFLLQMVCQKYTDPSKASLIMALESVFGTVFGVIFLNESVTIQMLFGGVLIFAAVFLSELQPEAFNFRSRKAKRRVRAEHAKT